MTYQVYYVNYTTLVMVKLYQVYEHKNGPQNHKKHDNKPFYTNTINIKHYQPSLHKLHNCTLSKPAKITVIHRLSVNTNGSEKNRCKKAKFTSFRPDKYYIQNCANNHICRWKHHVIKCEFTNAFRRKKRYTLMFQKSPFRPKKAKHKWKRSK